MIFQNIFCPIYDLLQGNNLFIVPTFQRPFRWEERHVSIFISDIAEACDAARIHYLSPMHLIKIDPAIPRHIELLNMYSDNHIRPNISPGAGALVNEHGIPVSVYLVVDGQQRLTSTLAVFRAFDVPLTSSITIGGQVYPKLIAGSQAEDTQVRIGLHLPNIAAPQNNAAAIRIQQAFATANERAAAIGNMPALRAFLLLNLKTLGVCLDPEFALGSFLTLNDRGKKLTILEKLKAHCMYLDLLRNQRDPFQVHTAFGILYRSLEQPDSLLTDDTAVQIATLFRVQGIVGVPREVVDWGADTCFEDVLANQASAGNLTPDNLDTFLHDIAQISNANDTLVQGLQDNALKGTYRLALLQWPLTHRTLAIVMKFLAMHNLTAADLVLRLAEIPLVSNIDFSSYLSTQLQLLNQPNLPRLLRACYRLVRRKIIALGRQDARQVNFLELAVMVDACGIKRVAFRTAWNQAFAPAAAPPAAAVDPEAAAKAVDQSFISWAPYLQNNSSRIRYLSTLMQAGDVSPRSLRYKIALHQDARQGKYWPPDTHSVEHIFARNFFDPNPNAPNQAALHAFGFNHIAEYQTFCGRIGNIMPLNPLLNGTLGNYSPADKAPYYERQTTPNGNNLVPIGMTPVQYSPTAVRLGRNIRRMNEVEQRAYIDLRSIYMVCFAASVI